MNVALTAISAGTTTTVAIYVAKISRRQWKTNQEKLRLDLYNHRFDIYLRVFDFYQALLEWKGTPEQVALQKPFMRALRESRFMFPDDSGVYPFLNEFCNHALRLTNFEQSRNAFAGFPQELGKLASDQSEHVNWIFASIVVLEDKMAPFLNFHSV